MLWAGVSHPGSSVEDQGHSPTPSTVPLQMGASMWCRSLSPRTRTTTSSTVRGTCTGSRSEWQSLWVSHSVLSFLPVPPAPPLGGATRIQGPGYLVQMMGFLEEARVPPQSSGLGWPVPAWERRKEEVLWAQGHQCHECHRMSRGLIGETWQGHLWVPVGSPAGVREGRGWGACVGSPTRSRHWVSANLT